MMHLDLRSKLIVFLSTVFSVSVLSKDTIFSLLAAILVIYVSLQGYSKSTIKLIIAMGALSFLRFVSNGEGFGILISDMFLPIVIGTLVIVPSVIPILKTPPGRIMAIMGEMKIYRNVALPLIFMMGFFPVAKSEFKEVIDSLRSRRLISIKKPSLTMEYLFVPMIFSSSKTVEELAAASEIRGISASGKHSSRREIRFRNFDVTVCLITIFIIMSMIFLKRSY